MTTFQWCKYRIRLFIRDVIAFIVFILLKIRATFIRGKQNGVRILVYHSIKNVPKNKDILRITVPPELFETHIKYLVCSEYEIISMDNLLNYISSSSKSSTGRKVVLTFDDGFADNFDYSCNSLRKIGLTATFFLVPNYIGSNKVFPWCSNNTSYSGPIDWQKALKIVSSGMTIGSHTLTHVNLGSISHDVNKIFGEISNSKKILEDRLKITVDYFAYPYGCKGSYNKATEDMIKKCGYKAACTNILGLNKKGDNVFELKRTRITWNDTLLRFRMKLEGAYDWVDRLWITSSNI